jgi:hypothetical protein
MSSLSFSMPIGANTPKQLNETINCTKNKYSILWEYTDIDTEINITSLDIDTELNIEQNLISLVPETIIKQKMERAGYIYESLGFKNTYVLVLIENLLYNSIELGTYQVEILKGDNQIILYTEKTQKDFRNLLIDEDCDISYLYFAKEKSKSERKMYFWDDGFDLNEIASLL